jgi:hypothetical protein
MCPGVYNPLSPLPLTVKSPLTQAYTLRRSDVRAYRATATKYSWSCPVCGRLIDSYSLERTIALAKIHLERKHGLEVRVE